MCVPAPPGVFLPNTIIGFISAERRKSHHHLCARPSSKAALSFLLSIHRVGIGKRYGRFQKYSPAMPRVVEERRTAEEKRQAEAVGRFYSACEHDAALQRAVDEHALATPLKWAASVLDVDALGVAGLRMLIESHTLVTEDCANPEVMVGRAIEALDAQVLPGELDGPWCRTYYWRSLATVVQVVHPIDFDADELPSVYELIGLARAALASGAVVQRLRLLGSVQQAVETHPCIFGPLPLHDETLHNVYAGAANACMGEPVGPLCRLPWPSDKEVEELYGAWLAAPTPKEKEKASHEFQLRYGYPCAYLIRALTELIAPSTESDYILEGHLRYTGWALRAMPLEDCWDMQGLRRRARLAAKGLAGSDAVLLPQLLPAETRGLAGLLAKDEGAAETIVALIPPCAQLAFKLTCRHFRRAQMAYGTPIWPRSSVLVQGRSPVRHTLTSMCALAKWGTPALLEWAISCGAPWPLSGFRVALKLRCSLHNRFEGDETTSARRACGIVATLSVLPRHVASNRDVEDIMVLGGGAEKGWLLNTARERLPVVAATHGNLPLLKWTLAGTISPASHQHLTSLSPASHQPHQPLTSISPASPFNLPLISPPPHARIIPSSASTDFHFWSHATSSQSGAS